MATGLLLWPFYSVYYSQRFYSLKRWVYANDLLIDFLISFGRKLFNYLLLFYKANFGTLSFKTSNCHLVQTMRIKKMPNELIRICYTVCYQIDAITILLISVFFCFEIHKSCFLCDFINNTQNLCSWGHYFFL